MVREFSDAALQGCRDKAFQKTAEFMGKLPQGMDDAEKFHLLSEQWKILNTCAGQCADNFDPELFLERENLWVSRF